MLPTPHRHLALVALLLVAPALSLASSITVNGTCETGTCPPTDTLSPGSSISTTNFNFTFDGFDISGEYKASNTTNSPSGFTDTQVDVTATYEGSTPLTAPVVLTVDDLQDFTVPSSYSLLGIYDEGGTAGFSGTVGAGSSITEEAFYNGQGVGLLGPFTTNGTSETASKSLTLSGTSLDVENQFVFTFNAGTSKGGSITTTPEPGGLIPVAAILLLCLGIPAIRRYRRLSSIG
jgi:hypothetical protein